MPAVKVGADDEGGDTIVITRMDLVSRQDADALAGEKTVSAVDDPAILMHQHRLPEPVGLDIGRQLHEVGFLHQREEFRGGVIGGHGHALRARTVPPWPASIRSSPRREATLIAFSTRSMLSPVATAAGLTSLSGKAPRGNRARRSYI